MKSTNLDLLRFSIVTSLLVVLALVVIPVRADSPPPECTGSGGCGAGCPGGADPCCGGDCYPDDQEDLNSGGGDGDGFIDLVLYPPSAPNPFCGFPPGPGGPTTSTGPGIHSDIATGNVWTEIPILKTFANDQTDLNLVLRYDSTRRFRDGPMGPGWSHAYSDTHGQSEAVQFFGSIVDEVWHCPACYPTYPSNPGGTSASACAQVEECWPDMSSCSCSLYEDAYFAVDYMAFRAPNGQQIIFRGDATPSAPTINVSGRFNIVWHRFTTDETGVTDYKFTIYGLGPDRDLIKVATYEKGQPVVRKDFRGRETTISRIVDHEVTVTSPFGKKIRFVYDSTDTVVTKIIHPDSVTLSGGEQSRETLLTYYGPYSAHPNMISTITDWQRFDGSPDISTTMSFEYLNRRLDKETLRNGHYFTVDYETNPTTSTSSIEIKDDEGDRILKLSTPGVFPDSSTGSVDPGTVTYTDGEGKDWIYTRNAMARITEIEDPNGESILYQYGTSGNSKNRLVKVTDQELREHEYEYDSTGNITKYIDPDDNETLYEFNSTASPTAPTKITYPGNRVHTYVYDSTSGELIKWYDAIDEEDPGQGIADKFTEYQFSASSGKLSWRKAIDRRGNVTKREFDPTTGALTKETVADGTLNLVREFESDANGRITKETIHRGDMNTVTDFEYDLMGRLTRRVIDPGSGKLALSTMMEYDGRGNLIKVTNPKNEVIEFEVDNQNMLTKTVVDPGTPPANLNLTTTWTLDGNGQPTTITDANGKTTTLHYDDVRRLDYVIDAEGDKEVYGYDKVGNVTQAEKFLSGASGASVITKFAYDDLNRVTSQVVADGTADKIETKYDYDSTSGCSCGSATSGARPQKITQLPQNTKTYMHYDDMLRLIKSVREVGGTGGPGGDSDDAIVLFEYDEEGNLTRTQGAEGEESTITYDGAGRRKTITGVLNGAGDVVTTLNYDGASNVTSIESPNGNELDFEYDAANRMTLASDDVGTVAMLTYDAAGNVVKRKDANNHEWQMGFDAAGRLVEIKDPIIESPDKFTSIEYDGLGNVTVVTDPAGIQTKNEYDNVSRLVKTIEDFGGADQADTEFVYNALGLLTELKDNEDNATGYTYDSAARVKTVTYPGSTGGSDLVTFGYDLANKKIKRTDQKGVVATIAYNDLGQSVSREYKQGTTTLLSETFTYDKSGRRLTGDNGFAKITNVFDKLGRLDLTKQKYLTENKEFTTDLDYTFGTSGSTRTLTYHSARTVTETLDKRGRLTDVTAGTGVGGDWSYDAADRLTSASLDNKVASTFSYDVNDRLTGIMHATDIGGVITRLYEVEYGYDVADNRLWTKNKLHANRSELYEYDRRHRLRKFQRGELSYDKASITKLAHATLPSRYDWMPTGWMDSRGNWATWAKEVGSTPVIKRQSRTHNGANEVLVIDPDVLNGLTTDQVLVSVDANGNLTTDPLAPNVGSAPPGQKYVYDAANRVTEIWRTNVASNPSDDELLVEIEYDAMGRRVQTKEWIDQINGAVLTTPNTTWHIYEGLNVIEEYGVADPGSTSATTNLARQFIWGQGFPAPVALIDKTDAGDAPAASGEEILHYIRDILGSVVALTNASGNVVERYEYDPYGNTYICDVDGNGDHDDTSYRTYSRFGNPWMWTGQRRDATTGTYHFCARTFSPNLGKWLQRDPLGYVDGVNLSSYSRSRPINLTDPLGLLTPRQYIDYVEKIKKKGYPNDADFTREQWDLVLQAAMWHALGDAGIDILKLSSDTLELYQKIIALWDSSADDIEKFYSSVMEEIEKLQKLHRFDLGNEELDRLKSILKDKRKIEALISKLQNIVDALAIIDALRKGEDVDPAEFLNALKKLMDMGDRLVPIPGMDAFFKYWSKAIGEIIRQLAIIKDGAANRNVDALINGQRSKRPSYPFGIEWAEEWAEKHCGQKDGN
ncbi:MAG TPA: RHS repeat-associated core domain-containing protein [Phycisphaerae bacterium]|nr:RHS repeat-associated core domain-containing protein [Phycisphaerae bacterium]